VGSVGAPEVLVILILALLVLGPERLPQAARTMGRWVGEIRRLTGSLQAEVQDVVDEVMRPVNETATVATESFTSTFSSGDTTLPVEGEGGTTASASVAEVEGHLPADVPLLPAPPADPSLN